MTSWIASVTPSRAKPCAPALAALDAISVAISFTAFSAMSSPKALTNSVPTLPGSALSRAPIRAPAPKAMPGASTRGSRSLIACCVSPTPRTKEGTNTPIVPPITVPMPGAIAVPAAPNVSPPTREGAISGICSPAVCFIQVKKSPAVLTSKNLCFCFNPPMISSRFSAAPLPPSSSRVSIPVASPVASTNLQPKVCSRSTPLDKLSVKVSCLAARSIPTRLGTSSDPRRDTRSSSVSRRCVTGALVGISCIPNCVACFCKSARLSSPTIVGGKFNLFAKLLSAATWSGLISEALTALSVRMGLAGRANGVSGASSKGDKSSGLNNPGELAAS